MLFLAVFSGFMAEYQLEHKIEKDRESQYINSLLADLNEDTIVLTETITEYNGHLKKNDTLINILTGTEIKNHTNDLYYFARSASRSVQLALHDFTIKQMKSSGGFRLIRNQNASKAIIEYYNRMIFIDYLQGIELYETNEYRKMAINVFHPAVFHDMISPDDIVLRPENNPALLDNEPKTLLQIAGMISYISNTKLGLIKAELEMKEAAIKLIALIKKEYQLN